MGEKVERAVRTIRWSEPHREFLVSVRANSTAGGTDWIDYAQPRRWDLLLNYYDQAPALVPPAEMVTLGGLSKFPAVWETNQAHGEFLANYHAALFIDDDITVRFEDVDRLFEIVSAYNLEIAQPSLSPQSHFSWPITLRRPAFRLRYTNFVEIMAPVFSASALARCLPTFRKSTSGWGLDLVWPALLGYPKDAIAIIDEIEMTHTKPIDPHHGRFYEYLRSLGIDADEEANALAREHGVERDYPTEEYGGVPAVPAWAAQAES